MSINLLPWRASERKLKWKKIIFRWLICFISTIIFSIILKNKLQNEIHLKENKIQLIENKLKIISIDPDAQKNNALLNKLKQYQLLKSKSIKINNRFKAMLADIANQLPDSLVLTKINMSEKKISIHGYGQNISDIHEYDEHLQSKNQWKKIILSNIKTDVTQASRLKFTIEITR